MDKRRAFYQRLAFFLCLAAVYGAIFAFLCRTPFYDVTGAHNDRLFSADDVYCATEFYSAQMDDSARIIKHPLFIVYGSLFTRAEEAVFGTISVKSHYQVIVASQMVISLLSTLYLERILRKQYGLKERRVLLLCGVYALAFSTLFYTFVAETYILSALLLLMTFYYAGEKNDPVTVLLGVCTAGVTITNAVLWAIIVFLAHRGSWKRRICLLVLGGAGFCVVTALLPVGDFFFASIISGGLSSAESFRDHFGPLELLVRIFFVFFGSTAFFLHTALETPFGDYPGDALSFLPSASWPIVVLALGWVCLLVWGVVRGRKSPLLWAPLGVLVCNLLLHGVIQYGLKEGFLYSLHHLPAQILLASLALRAPESRDSRWAEGFVWCYGAGLVLCNIPGYLQLVQFITR